MLQIIREGCSYTYPPLSIARYSFIQLSELEQCGVKTLAQDFNTVAQDSNPGSRSRKFETLPLSHCALHVDGDEDIHIVVMVVVVIILIIIIIIIIIVIIIIIIGGMCPWDFCQSRIRTQIQRTT